MSLTSLQERLRWLLAAGKVSARKASKLAGAASPAYVGMILRGDITDARTQSVGDIARAFGVSPAWLAFGIGDDPVADDVVAAVAAAGVADDEADDDLATADTLPPSAPAGSP